ncbi:MAG TPA: HAMP domain-containing methyl-accepting chemotaxis protein [Bradyrhizobium sp.]|nr:HAMP domain-containing methyl-accepting chemotaxis protein [Bradyrhizobium sp.]
MGTRLGAVHARRPSKINPSHGIAQITLRQEAAAMTKILNNMSITVKAFISPLLSAVVILGILGLFASLYHSILEISDTSDAVSRFQIGARQVRQDLTFGHANIYRAINAKSQGLETALVHKMRVDAIEAIKRAIAGTATLGAATNAGVDLALVEKTGAALKAYLSAAAQVAELVDDDAFSATMMLNDTEIKYLAAEKVIVPLDAAATERRQMVGELAKSELQQAAYKIGIASVGAILLSLGAAWLFARLLSRPIKLMTGAMVRLAGGDLAASLPPAENTDEVGAMAKALIVFRDNAIEARRIETEREKEQMTKAERAHRLEMTTQGFENAVGSVVDGLAVSADEMAKAAEIMTAATTEASSKSIAVTSASEEASANVGTVASATEELAASIREIGQRVRQSASVAQRADQAARGTSSTIDDLAERAQKIGQVVELISDIASQTNLLALNATIEAARAGEAGRGFAVVAAEVKGLATQTAKATEEITAQIEGIQTSTKGAVMAIEEIARTITEISSAATDIAATVEQQSAVTNEIASSVQQTATGTQDVSNNIIGVSTAVAQSSQVAAQVRSAAEDLSVQSKMLQQEVVRFLRDVKAA